MLVLEVDLVDSRRLQSAVDEEVEEYFSVNFM